MPRAKGLSDPKVTPIRRDNTVAGFILSIAFHAALIGAFWINWPYMRHETLIPPPLIVDLVPIDEITSAPPTAAPKTEEPAPEPEPQPEPPKQDTTPPPPPEPLPPPPPPKPAPAPPPVTPPPPPKPEPPKPKQKDDMASLQKLLKDMQKQQPKPPASPQAPTPDTSVNNQAPNVSDRATMTELDAIRHHFESCFRIDPGMEGIENMSVEIRVHIGLDGSVQGAEFLDITRYLDPTQPQYRTFANNVRISVLGCSGVPITADHYEELKSMILNFSPQGRIN